MTWRGRAAMMAGGLFASVASTAGLLAWAWVGGGWWWVAAAAGLWVAGVVLLTAAQPAPTPQIPWRRRRPGGW